MDCMYCGKEDLTLEERPAVKQKGGTISYYRNRCKTCYEKVRYQRARKKYGSDYMNSKARRNKYERRQKGLCGQCLNPLMKNNACYCERHYTERLFVQNGIRIGIEATIIEYNRMLNELDGKCPYTGVDLVLGENISIDHIIPKSKGGTNDITNITLCDTKINRMKLDNTFDELYSMCSRYVEMYNKSEGFKHIIK